MANYRISIDHDRCVGDKLCCEAAPDTFSADERGRITVIDPNGDSSEYIRSAARHCRLEAITLYDADTGEKVWPRN